MICMPGDESRRVVEELAESSHPSVRAAVHMSRVLLIKDTESATKYLHEQMEVEANPKVRKKYTWYINEVISRREGGRE